MHADVNPMTSHPFTLNPDNVREFPQITVKVRDFELKSGPATVVPIECERGTTGVMLIGNGDFSLPGERQEYPRDLPGSRAPVQPGRSACNHFTRHR